MSCKIPEDQKFVSKLINQLMCVKQDFKLKAVAFWNVKLSSPVELNDVYKEQAVPFFGVRD
jgi:hypothetical protein